MNLKKSPLSPENFPKLPLVKGMLMGTARSQVKYKRRDDILTVVFEKNTSVAGSFTQAQIIAAPVLFCKKNLKSGKAKALVVNAGIANSFTGKKGEENTKKLASFTSKFLNCRQKDVYTCSTGVIGEQIPLRPTIKAIKSSFQKKPASFENAAKAIMTTDTFPKGSGRTIKIDGKDISIVGIAKGSGMISPNMATMLAFIFTDAAIDQKIFQTLINLGLRNSFNAITVDGDTSTNDTVLAFATGKAMENEKIKPFSGIGDTRLRKFREALEYVMNDLALQIVRDGEGAQKLVEIKVSGAISSASAKKVARSVANSPLVKTAIAGSDPNWGRIIMAIGKTKENFSENKIKIKIGKNLVIHNGALAKRYSERRTKKYMRNNSILIEIDLGVGDSQSSIWTCDLTEKYIKINADYRS